MFDEVLKPLLPLLFSFLIVSALEGVVWFVSPNRFVRLALMLVVVGVWFAWLWNYYMTVL